MFYPQNTRYWSSAPIGQGSPYPNITEWRSNENVGHLTCIPPNGCRAELPRRYWRLPRPEPVRFQNQHVLKVKPLQLKFRVLCLPITGGLSFGPCCSLSLKGSKKSLNGGKYGGLYGVSMGTKLGLKISCIGSPIFGKAHPFA